MVVFTTANASTVGSSLVLLRRAINFSMSCQFGALRCKGGARPYGSAITLGMGPDIGVKDATIAGALNPIVTPRNNSESTYWPVTRGTSLGGGVSGPTCDGTELACLLLAGDPGLSVSSCRAGSVGDDDLGTGGEDGCNEFNDGGLCIGIGGRLDFSTVYPPNDFERPERISS